MVVVKGRRSQLGFAAEQAIGGSRQGARQRGAMISDQTRHTSQLKSDYEMAQGGIRRAFSCVMTLMVVVRDLETHFTFGTKRTTIQSSLASLGGLASGSVSSHSATSHCRPTSPDGSVKAPQSVSLGV
jgi:hypothetical protein